MWCCYTRCITCFQFFVKLIAHQKFVIIVKVKGPDKSEPFERFYGQEESFGEDTETGEINYKRVSVRTPKRGY